MINPIVKENSLGTRFALKSPRAEVCMSPEMCGDAVIPIEPACHTV